MWIESVGRRDLVSSRYIASFRIEQDNNKPEKWYLMVAPARGREIITSIHPDEESARQAMIDLKNKINAEFKRGTTFNKDRPEPPRR